MRNAPVDLQSLWGSFLNLTWRGSWSQWRFPGGPEGGHVFCAHCYSLFQHWNQRNLTSVFMRILFQPWEEHLLHDLCPPVQIDEMLLSHATLLERTILTKRGVANQVFFYRSYPFFGDFSCSKEIGKDNYPNTRVFNIKNWWAQWAYPSQKWNKQSQPGQEYGGRDGLSRSGWIFLVQAIAIGLLGLQISSHCGDFGDFWAKDDTVPTKMCLIVQICNLWLNLNWDI